MQRPAWIKRAADDACYRAKKNGRNRIHTYQATDDELAARQGELDWVARLRPALHEGRIDPLLTRSAVASLRLRDRMRLPASANVGSA